MVPALMICISQISLLSLIAGDAPLDSPLPVAARYDWIQYDDGTAAWMTWSGLYRGVWFNIQDFAPGFPYSQVYGLEFWFYHPSSYTWDVSSFLAEIYEGDAVSPVTQMDQTSVTAFHYAPCYTSYSPEISMGINFWGLVNTEMSGGGWPSILGDNTPQAYSHSFYSDDFIVWQPWVVGGPAANDFFIRADAYTGWPPGLDQTTWGAIKTLF
jgi:hypothetical protein